MFEFALMRFPRCKANSIIVLQISTAGFTLPNSRTFKAKNWPFKRPKVAWQVLAIETTIYTLVGYNSGRNYLKISLSNSCTHSNCICQLVDDRCNMQAEYRKRRSPHRSDTSASLSRSILVAERGGVAPSPDFTKESSLL